MLLITGAAGFIGSCFVRRLSSTTPMCLIDKLTYAGSLRSISQVLEREDVEFYQLDIAQRDKLFQLMQDGNCRAVVHFAAETHVDRSIEAPDVFTRTNVLGTSRLLSATLAHWQRLSPAEREAFRFIHISTDEVYGSAPPGQIFDEQAPLRPSSPYAASKAASNLLVQSFAHTYALPVLIANCSNCFGPFQYPEKLIPLMILSAVDNLPLPIYGDGEQRRQWLFVESCAEAIELLYQRGLPGETYNIAPETEMSNLDVVRRICRFVAQETGQSNEELEGRIEFVADRPGHDRRYAMDSEKFQKQTGWKPRSCFDEQLQQTVRWYLNHTEWVDEVREAARQRRGLGFAG